MPVYRYDSIGGYAQELVNSVPSTPTLGDISIRSFVDITAPIGSKDDLDAYMASKGYSYRSQDPPTTPFIRFNDVSGKWEVSDDGVNVTQAGAYVQRKFSEISVDVSTNLLTYTNLLTTNITTLPGTYLLIWFTIAGSLANSSQQAAFRMRVDGVTLAGVGIRSPAGGSPAGAAVVHEASGLAAGAHTVTIDWRVTGSTASIRPVTQPEWEHCSMLVMEVGI